MPTTCWLGGRTKLPRCWVGGARTTVVAPAAGSPGPAAASSPLRTRTTSGSQVRWCASESARTSNASWPRSSSRSPGVGIAAPEFRARQQHLLQHCLPPRSLCILPGHGITYSHDNIFHPFFQYPNLRYYTGWEEPNAVLVLHNLPSAPGGSTSALFVAEQTPTEVQWDGRRAGLAEAACVADQSHPLRSLPRMCEAWAPEVEHVFVDTDMHLPMLAYPEAILPALSPLLPLMGQALHCLDLRPRGPGDPPSLPALPRSAQDRGGMSALRRSTDWIAQAIASQRIGKSPAELALLRRCGKMSGRAVNQVIRHSRGLTNERQVYALMDYHTRREGCDALGYVPVVAAGANALTIHHTSNRSPIRPTDMVLMDAAGILDGYHADITRTWPISGTFTPPQRALYQLVLDVQKAMIALCRPSRPEAPMSLDELQRRTYGALWAGVRQLLGRDVDRDEMDRLYPHHVSHYVGLSLHDTPSIPRSVPLAPGMVVTVEPGLYVPDEPAYGPYRGLGVRIEDVVAVQLEGPVILTVEAVKEVVDVEALMRGAREEEGAGAS